MPTPSAAERIEIERACERIVYAYSRALDLGDMSARSGLLCRERLICAAHGAR